MIKVYLAHLIYFVLNKSKKVNNLDTLFRRHKDKNIDENNDILLEILTGSVNEEKWDITENVIQAVDIDNLNRKKFIQYTIDISQYYIETKQFELAKKLLLSQKYKIILTQCLIMKELAYSNVKSWCFIKQVK